MKLIDHALMSARDALHWSRRERRQVIHFEVYHFRRKYMTRSNVLYKNDYNGSEIRVTTWFPSESHVIVASESRMPRRVSHTTPQHFRFDSVGG